VSSCPSVLAVVVLIRGIVINVKLLETKILATKVSIPGSPDNSLRLFIEVKVLRINQGQNIVAPVTNSA
jgi:hypothetical protein